MTSDGFGEMFEGDSADTCAGKFLIVLMKGPSGGSCVPRPGSEDPHRREWKLLCFTLNLDIAYLFVRNRTGARVCSSISSAICSGSSSHSFYQVSLLAAGSFSTCSYFAFQW